jgi:uncharacterized caspase-like protein
MKVKVEFLYGGLIEACESVGAVAPGKIVYWFSKIQRKLKDAKADAEKAKNAILKPFADSVGKIMVTDPIDADRVTKEIKDLMSQEIEIGLEDALDLVIESEKKNYTSTDLEILESSGIIKTVLK